MIWIGEPFCLRTCIDRGCPKLCKIDISQRIIYSWIFIEDFNSVRFNRNFQRGNSLPEARTICCAKAGPGCWPSQLCILVIFIPILINFGDNYMCINAVFVLCILFVHRLSAFLLLRAGEPHATWVSWNFRSTFPGRARFYPLPFVRTEKKPMLWASMSLGSLIRWSWK